MKQLLRNETLVLHQNAAKQTNIIHPLKQSKMKHKLVLLFSILFTLSIGAQGIGDIAPNFSLKSLDNKTVQLSDYKGKVVMVFLFGYGCPFCISGAPKVKSAIIDKYSGNPNFVAIGIDTWNGSSSGVQNFNSATSLNIPLLQQGGSLASTWKMTYDRIVIIDHEGKFVFRGTTGVSNDATRAGNAVSIALGNLPTALEEVFEGSGQLSNVFPNPAIHEANIQFKIDKPGFVKLNVYDLSGNVVRQLLNESKNTGTYTISFSKDDLPKGLYFYRLENDNSSDTGKIVFK